MTGILLSFKREVRIEKRDDGWMVVKKYHGYWYDELPIALPKKLAKKAMEKIKERG